EDAIERWKDRIKLWEVVFGLSGATCGRKMTKKESPHLARLFCAQRARPNSDSPPECMPGENGQGGILTLEGVAPLPVFEATTAKEETFV
ncbi:MAG: hypothetical protein K0S99_3021, partial [Thermomicrobiales bacterium]|nr:hypothetical protein [Thermomicrobiales bacterium]